MGVGSGIFSSQLVPSDAQLPGTLELRFRSGVGVGSRCVGVGSRFRMPSSLGQGRCEGDQSFKIRVAGERDGGAGLTVHGQKFIRRLQEGSIQDKYFSTCFLILNMPIDLVL